jgi:hypothetical protein
LVATDSAVMPNFDSINRGVLEIWSESSSDHFHFG